MKKHFWISLFVALLILNFACSKKEVVYERYTAEELVKTLGPVKEVKREDPKYIPLQLEFYGKGIIVDTFKVLSYRDLSFLAIEFESEAQAKGEALRLKQYYFKNWLLDSVAGEPSLEDLVIHNLKAENPSLAHQITPRHIPEAASGEKKGH